MKTLKLEPGYCMYNRWESFETYPDYAGPPLREWQEKALMSWEANSNRGIVEAVTGTGKTMVGIAAIREVTSQGGYALVLVPTKALAEQWMALIERYLPSLRAGRLGDGQKNDFRTSQVVVANIQSVRSPMPSKSLTLVVADEVHRYGAQMWAKALDDRYTQRLGLTGTYERQSDDGVMEVLTPYFSGKVFSYRYPEALQDSVVAPFALAFVGVDFTVREQETYQEAQELADRARDKLVYEFGYDREWLDFFSRVNQTLRGNYDDALETRLCQRYMKGWSARRQITANAVGKIKLVERVSRALPQRSGTLVFSSTVDSVFKLAHVISKYATVVALHGGSTNEERQLALNNFRDGKLDVICAPQILNEGIDVPDAEVAIIIGASQNRREMIQRMGRVVRLKDSNRCARILITYVRGTPEDPATGGHEAFLSEVKDHAADTSHFSGDDPLAVAEWFARDFD